MEKPNHTEAEREFATRQASSLTDRQFRSFMAGCFTSKPTLMLNRDLVLFSGVAGKPTLSQAYTLVDAWCDIQDGACVELQDGLGIRRTVGHEPVELAEGVFVWMPRYTMIERFLQNGVYQSRISVAIRSMHNPNYPLIESSNYLVPQHVFDTICKG